MFFFLHSVTSIRKSNYETEKKKLTILVIPGFDGSATQKSWRGLWSNAKAITNKDKATKPKKTIGVAIGWFLLSLDKAEKRKRYNNEYVKMVN